MTPASRLNAQLDAIVARRAWWLVRWFDHESMRLSDNAMLIREYRQLLPPKRRVLFDAVLKAKVASSRFMKPRCLPESTTRPDGEKISPTAETTEGGSHV